MTIESVIGIISGLIAIGGLVWGLYQRFKKQSLKDLMNQLANKDLTREKHKKILKKMNRRLVGYRIKDNYIESFVLNNRGRETLFMDICESNDIEPTKELCVKFMGSDMPKFRTNYYNKRNESTLSETPVSTPSCNKEQIVFMSELLLEKHPTPCKDLIKILEKHNVKYAFIKGTKDIWCRDYMPVQTQSGKFIQFKYDPSYLKGNKEWEASRSDVKEVCKVNNIKAQFSDINIDGGNVLICDGRAILSDRIFSENPNKDKDALISELSKLLECEIIIIPAINGDYTGHADGMVRFVNRNTILGNRLADEYKYWQNGMKKVLATYDLTYIDIPFLTDMKGRNYPESAIGIYANYLEVNDLIVVPRFNRDEDKQVVEILQKAFPNKHIETIDYNEVAREGGLLNCTTWVVNN